MTTTVTANSYFKTVTKKDSAHYGEKRPDLEWQFEGLDAQDIISCENSGEAEKLATILNDALEKYGKELLIKNGEDWEFVPSSTNVNVSELYKSLTTVSSRKKKVTKETLALAGAFYESYAPELIDKKQEQASAGAMVISQKLKPIAAKTDALEVLKNNCIEFLEAAATESENNLDIAEKLDNTAEVFDWIISQCDKLIAESQEDIASAL